MELEQFSELYRRIQTDPSILLLGQGYLCLESGLDPIWTELVKEDAYKEFSPHKVDYPTLWETVVGKEEDARQLMTKIHAVADRISPQHDLRVMLDLHWSMLYTSAIDKGLLPAAGEGFGFNDEPSREQTANRRFMNKNQRYCVTLCESDNKPFLLNSTIAKRRFENSILRKLDWIPTTYLRDYGVLVIDGCDPEHDWLTDERLFSTMDSMPYDSIYWFSAPPNLPPFAQVLERSGVLTAETDSFISHLHRHLPELFEEENEESHYDSALYSSLTLHFKNRPDRVVHIPRARITEINGNTLCLLDDEILAKRSMKFDNRALSFAQFLVQKNLPSWNLFRSEPNQPSFYFERDKDKELEKKVQDLLSISDGSRRRPLLLEGPSNSGKTTMLANLALKLASLRKFPVIFLHGDLVLGAEERLQAFLKEWFLQENAFDGERVEKILIIWDGNSVQNDWRRYYNLQKQLFTSNVLVVGSCYNTNKEKIDSICLEPDLNDWEFRRLQKVVESLGGEFYERFQAIKKSNARNQIGSHCGQNSLLYILQTLFRFEFDAEYREVSRMLKQQFGRERIFVENSAAESLRQYVDDYNDTISKIAKYGGAASYQLKLQLYLQQNFPEATAENPEAENALPDTERRHIRMREAIQHLNRALALAGEFGVLLPSSLLLHLLKDENGSSYVCYGSDTAQLFDVLKNDSLIEEIRLSTDYFGDEQFYRFRNSLEAENYICLLDALPMGESSPKRLEREYSILRELMDAAHGEEDLMTVIELIRQFGPNGHGKLSEQDKRITTGNYSVYREYWERIAGHLIELFSEDPEAVLVYSHLMREANSPAETAHQEGYAEEFSQLYGEVRTRLESAIQQLEQSGKTQSSRWCRLNIERCANLQQSMRCGDFNFVNYQTIVETIHTVFNTAQKFSGKERSQRYEFSSNYMLDILLNAFSSYISDFKVRKHCTDPQKCMEDPEFQTQLIARVHDIDVMLSLDDMIHENNSANLLRKITQVYEYLGTSKAEMKKLEISFQSRNSDAYIYMRARSLWQSPFAAGAGASNPKDLLGRDRYLLVCNHDLPYMELEDQADAVTKTALEDATKVIDYLRSQEGQIKAVRSERCMMMLIRARWFELSGKPMLAQKQKIPFTKSQWDELIDMCRAFVSYHEIMNLESFPPAYFLLGIHEWMYGNPGKANEYFRTARSDSYGDYVTIERLVLCRWGTKQERTFKVRVQKNENSRCTATVIGETTPASDWQDQIVGRYNVAVPKHLREYLFREAPPRAKEFNPRAECTIRFNLSGPQLGLCQEGGTE